MKPKTIKLFATQIPYTDGELDDLEENEVYVEFNISELLDEIDNEDIEEYARYDLDMLHEDDFKSNLEDFSENEIVQHLRDGWFDFTDEVSEEEMIDILEDKGYTVSDDGTISNDYDYVDSCLFEDIISVFDSLSCAKKQELHDLIINFK